MDAERELVSKVAQAGGLDQMLGEGIGAEHFSDPMAADVWRFMSEHSRKYRQRPSMAAIRERFPDYDMPMVPDALDYVRDRFREHLQRRYAIEALHGLAAALDDPEQARNIESLFSEQARRLSQVLPGSRVERLSGMKERIEDYERTAADGDVWGIRMGIPTFDQYTYGIQPHEYVTISGWLGTGKSTLCQWMLLNSYQQDRKPLYISLEMEARALLRKWDVMLTNVSYSAMKSGTLSPEEVKKWREVADAVDSGKAKRDIVVLDDIMGCTVDRVYAEIQKHRPDIVALDYLSLMSASRSASQQTWEKMMYISNNLKQIARATKTPIVAVAQTNRNSVDSSGGPELQHIAHSVAINQDSDIVISLYRDEEMRENNRMQVKLLKNRDGRIGEESLYWDMERMEFHQATGSDMFRRKKEEAAAGA